MTKIIDLITQAELIEFSSNFNVTDDSNILDQLFPNQKTDDLEVAIMNYTKDQAVMALVHAFDTEAEMGQRPEISAMLVKKFLIKEKLPFGAELMEKLRKYKDLNELKKSVFNDVARTSNDVLMRTRVMKAELLSTGKITVNENNVKQTIDFKVPVENKPVTDWDAETPDIEEDILKWQEILSKQGYVATRAITSNKYLMKLRKLLKTQINGEMGGLPTIAQINDYLDENYQIRIQAIENQYRYYDVSNKKIVSKRYIPEDKFILLGGEREQEIGRGLYGVTPEESLMGLDSKVSESSYIVNTIWEETDPVATWTKASAVFIPVLRDPNSLIIATV